MCMNLEDGVISILYCILGGRFCIVSVSEIAVVYGKQMKLNNDRLERPLMLYPINPHWQACYRQISYTKQSDSIFHKLTIIATQPHL